MESLLVQSGRKKLTDRDPWFYLASPFNNDLILFLGHLEQEPSTSDEIFGQSVTELCATQLPITNIRFSVGLP